VSGLTHEQHERLDELLADRALEGLASGEIAECDGLLARLGSLADNDSMDRIVAALQLALETEAVHEPMPDTLRQRVASRLAQAASAPPVVATIRPGRRGVSPWWIGVAALVGLLIGAWPLVAPLAGSTPGARRTALVQDAADLVRAPWSAAGELEGRDVSGEAVWSTDRQEGYMRFVGLPVNDPSAEQYQLWIFDPSQPEATPIDGGVFDVAATGEVVVPIDAKLRVNGPTLFALTIEKPGGVVVSDRKRLVLVGSPG